MFNDIQFVTVKFLLENKITKEQCILVHDVSVDMNCNVREQISRTWFARSGNYRIISFDWSRDPMAFSRCVIKQSFDTEEAAY